MLNIQVERRAAWGPVGAVTLGIFTVMTAELLPVGLLTPVGAELSVSAGTAGLMVTVPGLVAAVAVSAPLIALRAAGADRRAVLVLMALALGALLGGLLVDATTLSTVLLTGAALTLAACLAAVLPGRTHPA